MTSPRITTLRPTRGVRLLRFGIVLVLALALAVLTGRYLAENNVAPGGTPDADVTASIDSGEPSPIVIKQTAELADLYPGAPAQVLSGTFSNAGTGSVYIGSIEATLAEVTGGRGSCSLAGYELLNPVMPVGRSIPVGTDVAEWGGATIRMIDLPDSQDGCQLSTVNISYVAR
ncbi:MAG: hypothetical protein WD178_05830 [Actinomycetota bacterium]